jgi:hypothetical protein
MHNQTGFEKLTFFIISDPTSPTVAGLLNVLSVSFPGAQVFSFMGHKDQLSTIDHILLKPDIVIVGHKLIDSDTTGENFVSLIRQKHPDIFVIGIEDVGKQACYCDYVAATQQKSPAIEIIKAVGIHLATKPN